MTAIDDMLITMENNGARFTEDVAELKAEKGRLPSQSIPNPNGSVNAVMLQNGMQLKNVKKKATKKSPAEDYADVTRILHADVNVFSYNSEDVRVEEKEKTSAYSSESQQSNLNTNPPLPFPLQVSKPKRNIATDKELLELFSRVEITIPLLDAIKQIPKYAKFLKELCTNRRGGHVPEQINLKNIATVLQCKIAPKC